MIPDKTALFLEGYGFFDSGKKVLDIGCFNGRFMDEVTRNGFQYLGLDVSKESIQSAKIRHSERTHMSWAAIDVWNQTYNPDGKKKAQDYTFPLKDKSVDSILMHSVMTHIGGFSSAKNYMDECYRMLKPGGKLWVTWFKSPPNEVSRKTARTVFEVVDIEKMCARFNELYRSGGETEDYNDQMGVILEK